MAELKKDELILRCAFLFYNDKLNIKEVSERLNISRFKVSRYLKEAEDKKIVEVRFNAPDIKYQTLAMEIEKLYPINRVVIVPLADEMGSDMIRRAVGRKGADILSDLDDNLAIGITWGRTIAYMVEDLPVGKRKFKSISELTGGFGIIGPGISTSSLAPLLARKTLSLCYQMPAPIMSSDRKIAESLMSDVSMIKTLDIAKNSDVAVFGMSPVTEDAMLYRSGLIDDHDLEELHGLGAAGTMLGRFFNCKGEEIDTQFRSRSISISWEDFKRIPERIGLIGGIEKAECANCLLKSGMMTTVVMDSNIAAALLEKENKAGNKSGE